MIFEIDGSLKGNGWKVENLVIMHGYYDQMGGWLDIIQVAIRKGDLQIDFYPETYESQYSVTISKKRENGEYDTLTWEEFDSLGLDYPMDSPQLNFDEDLRVTYMRVMGYQLVELFTKL